MNLELLTLIKLIKAIYIGRYYLISFDIGKKKVIVTKKKIQMIDKKIKIKNYDIKVNKQNLKKIIKNYDYIIDGTDNFISKLSINDECIRQRKSYLLVQ